MDISAEINTHGTSCAERQKLGLAVRNAIENVYVRRSELEDAERHGGPGLREATAALQAARAASLAAQREYDQHLLTHGCLASAVVGGSNVG